MIYISEIFEEFEKAKTKQDRIAVLQKYYSNRTFVAILSGTFDPRIEFVQIPRKFTYTPSDVPYGFAFTTLAHEHRKLGFFLKRYLGLEDSGKLTKLRILIESLHAGEAEVLMGMLKKNLKVKGLSKSLIKELFPQFFPSKE